MGNVYKGRQYETQLSTYHSPVTAVIAQGKKLGLPVLNFSIRSLSASVANFHGLQLVSSRCLFLIWDLGVKPEDKKHPQVH